MARKILVQDPFPIELVWLIFLGLLNALIELRDECKLLHRDLVDVNVLIGWEEVTCQGLPETMLIDFGTSKTRDECRDTATWIQQSHDDFEHFHVLIEQLKLKSEFNPMEWCCDEQLDEFRTKHYEAPFQSL